MKSKISLLKLNIIISMFLWCVTGTCCILYSFKVGGTAFYLSMAVSAVLSSIVLYREYTPFIYSYKQYDTLLLFGSRQVYPGDIIRVIELTPLEKILFAVKSPEYDYSKYFFKKGLLLKTHYDSYLVDYYSSTLINSKKLRTVSGKPSTLILFYLFSILPTSLVFTGFHSMIDPLIYPVLMFITIFVIGFRFLPPFYLGTKIDINTLPLSLQELGEFKKITVIEGFLLSDKISVIPFKKPVRLEGLAVDILFRKYIILNPRLFSWGSDDYLRFVLFHELSHIKHHDSSKVFIAAAIISLLDLAISILPPGISSIIYDTFPYYEYILFVIAALYIITIIIKRKKVEQRADRAGIQAIGDGGIERVFEKTGINLKEL